MEMRVVYSIDDHVFAVPALSTGISSHFGTLLSIVLCAPVTASTLPMSRPGAVGRSLFSHTHCQQSLPFSPDSSFHATHVRG